MTRAKAWNVKCEMQTKNSEIVIRWLRSAQVESVKPECEDHKRSGEGKVFGVQSLEDGDFGKLK